MFDDPAFLNLEQQSTHIVLFNQIHSNTIQILIQHSDDKTPSVEQATTQGPDPPDEPTEPPPRRYPRNPTFPKINVDATSNPEPPPDDNPNTLKAVATSSSKATFDTHIDDSMDDQFDKLNKLQSDQELLNIHTRDATVRHLSSELAAASSTIHGNIKHRRAQSRSRDRKAKPIIPDVEVPVISDQQPPLDSGAPPIITTSNI